MTPVLAPQPTKDDRHFWEGIATGKLLLQRCSDCRTTRHPPRPMCGACNSLQWETFPSSLRGTVISWIIPRHPPVAPGEEQLIGLVETDEGARVVLNLHGFEAGTPINEARVEIFMLDVGEGLVLPQGRPAASDAEPA